MTDYFSLSDREKMTMAGIPKEIQDYWYQNFDVRINDAAIVSDDNPCAFLRVYHKYSDSDYSFEFCLFDYYYDSQYYMNNKWYSKEEYLRLIKLGPFI